ncbi:MAG TPA: CYTH and CHAD domain-containing protein [Ornithinimicrobium sp.]|uniref:CYTH and CHAD domain-containing protein n=1 Tax=Ornithinimicrobium sp. TaxID=1977084 RepID=UPI002B463604|nr:CYTH and CHAD domain-containing protein [Ornithinimicrobium sp.]HKJ12887.1 CYTH and CHAD domain-containing protein [Ornithinimicrobium sp.]
MTVHGEVETTYEADLDLDLPTVLEDAVGAVDAVARIGEPGHLSLDATYYDTDALDLAATGITLRRRSGGEDAGWHLKVPHREDEKVEKQVPLSAARHRVPAALRRLVWARTLGEDLAPVVRIETERTTYDLTDSRGASVAEVADDRVRATRLDDHDDVEAVLVWREVEAELTDAGPEVLQELDRSLTAHGLQRAHGAARSKVLRVLGDGVPSPSVAPSSTAAAAAEVVLHHLHEQIEQLRTYDPLVRLDRPDSVHRMRVAARRLRSALKTFGPLLPAEQSESLRADLKWLGEHLAPARDAEVMLERMERVAEQEGDDTPGGQLARDVARRLHERYRIHHEDVVGSLDSERYQALVRQLVELTDAAATTPAGRLPAADVLPARVRRAFRSLRRSVATAAPGEDGADPGAHDADLHAADLHEVRKKAKRARYAAEALSPSFGEPAVRLAQAMEQVQADLGEHQDTVVLRTWLHEQAQEASPASAFALGRWYAAEEQRGREAEERFTRSWRAARKKKLRRWLS